MRVYVYMCKVPYLIDRGLCNYFVVNIKAITIIKIKSTTNLLIKRFIFNKLYKI